MKETPEAVLGLETVSDELIQDLVASCPKTIWIELTSKCPFDCVFCSRKHERGSGQHMSFALYESLIGQLQKPEIIRLNYSGESMHYPRLAEAIRLARYTGATTELVSALGSATQTALQSLVDTGLHRLSVSLHSMEAAQFRAIYGRGDISDIRDRLDYLQRYKIKRDSKYPEIDFAFVAMHDNLSQLLPLVEYARALGVTNISIHPVIRRAEIPHAFPQELNDAGNLRIDFAARIRGEVEKASSRYAGITITIARPDEHMMAPGGITTCEQNPWDTVHVLANGSIVLCEVQDQVEIGDLGRQTLAEIWNGSIYQNFRRRYVNGAHPACAACPWRRTVAFSAAKKILVRGWHPSLGETVEWSEASAAVAVPIQPGVAVIRVAGILPPPPNGSTSNSLAIRHGKNNLVRIVNDTEDLLPFEAVVPTKARQVLHPAVLRFEAEHPFCPAERGQGADFRNLGFALTDLSFGYAERRKEKVNRLLDQLERVERIGLPQSIVRWTIPKALTPAQFGVSVVVPARDTPDLLVSTLARAEVALARIGEPSELIVAVSGVESSAYAGLRGSFPAAKWIFRSKVLDYVRAVELGLRHSKYPWLYLLNSDMHLLPNALTEVLKLRRYDTFAVGTRIRMLDGSDIETNWTDLRYCENDAAELIERDPADVGEPRGCLYVGGGSGLFRASVLRRFIKRTRAYAPFYWEDVEWGTLAWRYGYQSIFCPSSEAIHGHRQTIARYYDAAEVTRLFERNRLLFHLRNLSGVRCLERKLLSLDQKSWVDIFQPTVLFDMAWARARAFMTPQKEDVLLDRWRIAF
jgi:GT2 family glycosyltransferase/molybdenum cofactor biosynthesis enzyme MoaA